MRKFLLALFTCLSVLQIAFTQTVADNRRKYESAKDLLKQEKYALAQELLRPLLVVSPENPFAAYAHYLTAYAAYKLHKPDDAKLTLMQLQQKFPSWPDQDQAHYLMATLFFDKKDYTNALTEQAQLRTEKMKAEGTTQATYYLSQEANVGTLKTLQTKFPSDRALAEVLVNKLWLSTHAADKDLAAKLNAQFKLKKEESAPVRKVETKSSYNVAVLLPFDYAKLVVEKSGRVSPIAVDMYNGIRLAQQKLAQEGVQINLLAYDVGADGSKMTQLVSQPDFRANDMIIGPINGSSIRVAVTYASQAQIPQVNPITTNSQIVQGNPFSYLYQSSVESQTSYTAAFAKKQFAPSTLIFYGTTPKDSAMAFLYRKKFLEGGGKVLAFKKIASTAAAPQMTAAIAANPTAGHIFITSAVQTVAISLVSFLEKENLAIPVITQDNWLSYPMLSYNQFEKLQFYFISPEYIDYRSPEVIAFKKTYVEAQNLIPSMYSYQGYDMMLFFGRMLKEFGSDFQKGLQSKPLIKGAIFTGYDFHNSNDNQYVPIAKFENGNYILANPLE